MCCVLTWCECSSCQQLIDLLITFCCHLTQRWTNATQPQPPPSASPPPSSSSSSSSSAAAATLILSCSMNDRTQIHIVSTQLHTTKLHSVLHISRRLSVCLCVCPRTWQDWRRPPALSHYQTVTTCSDRRTQTPAMMTISSRQHTDHTQT